ncbi:PH domain-containing protein [Oerskovia sp. Sa1BUA8]|uniref:PH domain-containing protein n=1 Tax=Oerskovia douganii TaxID=2762210 RepID=A0A9D5UEL7_9CELL|nr:PH domain-containing protein [Oerskovia douganii]MBE7699192.1 PH domain-containing protein [Oerskovia douganii]
MSESTTQPDAPPTDLTWHRVHPVTPVVRGWSVIAVLLVIVGNQTLDGLPAGQNMLAGNGWWQILGGIVLVGLIGLGYSALAWRMTTYAIDDESVRLHTGVLFRQQRKARLDRLQAVDIVQPLVARLFGLAELKLEVAGGADSGIKLGFLKLEEADHLRVELLARAAGLRVGGPAARPATPGEGASDGRGEAPENEVPTDGSDVVGHVSLGVPEAPEQPVMEVPPGRLVLSLVRTVAMIVLVVAVLGLIGVAVGTREIGTLFTALPLVLGVGGYLFGRFTREFNFRSAISPDGIRLRHGLLETRSQTIPPGRVQAIRLTQGLLWRSADWWRVEVNVAGYGQSSDGTTNNSVLLPVGTRDEALGAVWLVLPDLGTPDPRGLLDEALSGIDAGAHFTTAPRRARILDPIAWRRNGFTVTGRALVLRRGRLVRRVEIVPHERTQSLGLQQGPWQRRLGVATFAMHSVPGPVTPAVPHLDQHVAGALMDEQARRAREARAHAGPELWMRRDEVAAVVEQIEGGDDTGQGPGSGPHETYGTTGTTGTTGTDDRTDEDEENARD